MEIRCFAFLALVLLSAACRGPLARPASDLGLPDSGPVESLRLPGATGWLLVSGSEQDGASWLHVAGRRIRPLPPPPVALFPREFSLSPDGRYLAVISVGEGHPILDVLDVSQLVAGTHGKRALWTLDPYPGSLSLGGWEGTRLRVLCDRFLTAYSHESGRVPGLEVSETTGAYLIDVATGAISGE